MQLWDIGESARRLDNKERHFRPTVISLFQYRDIHHTENRNLSCLPTQHRQKKQTLGQKSQDSANCQMLHNAPVAQIDSIVGALSSGCFRRVDETQRCQQLNHGSCRQPIQLTTFCHHCRVFLIRQGFGHVFASVCRHCDEVNLPSVTLLINRDGFVCCLTYSAATLIEFVTFPFAPLVETFHLVHHTSKLWIVFRTADHDVVNVKAHESLEFATNVPSHQTCRQLLQPSCCVSRTSDFHQRLGASVKP